MEVAPAIFRSVLLLYEMLISMFASNLGIWRLKRA
jgi:hypothetical protein